MSDRSGLLVKMDVLSGALRVASMLRYLHENMAATLKLASETLAEARAEMGHTCVWSRADDDTDLWEGSCGVSWSIPDGTPDENEMNYCPRCGAKLEQQETTDEHA